jgi:hypothetical protein
MERYSFFDVENAYRIRTKKSGETAIWIMQTVKVNWHPHESGNPGVKTLTEFNFPQQKNVPVKEVICVCRKE